MARSSGAAEINGTRGAQVDAVLDEPHRTDNYSNEFKVE
jgi:hypothetical protein